MGTYYGNFCLHPWLYDLGNEEDVLERGQTFLLLDTLGTSNLI